MNSTELYDFFRSDVQDNVVPYLWTDDEVFTYMNDAYTMFVRLTGGISDFSSAATEVTVTLGESFSNIDRSIMRIRTAAIGTDETPIKIINAQDINELVGEDYNIIRSLNSTTTNGKPRYMIIGMEPGRVRWAPIPDADYTVRLLVERLVKDPIEGLDQELADVDPHHHLHLVKWMRALAYRKQDPETINTVKAERESAEFMAYCDLATREKERARHKVRVVRYGGI